MGQAYPQVDGGVRLNRTERDASQRRGGRLSDYQSLVARISSCTKCTLSRGRNKTVPGDGALDADFMFIGEGPGFHEDRQGLPFVGQAGNLLNEMLALIGLARGDVYITNMIKCRPPNNRDPFPVEISSCRPYLDEQIEMIEPKVIVTLGRFSFSKFFPGEAIGKARGKPRNWNGLVVYPMYHPAAALRNPRLRTALESDFSMLPDLIRQVSERRAFGEEPEQEAADQLSMF